MAKKIPKKAADSGASPLTEVEKKAFGIPWKASDAKETDVKEEPYVVLKYLDPSFQCLSEWTANELRGLMEMVDRIRSMSWPEIYRTAGSAGNKTGLGYTKHGPSVRLPESKRVEKLSPDLTFFELRVSEKARVHGFRLKSAFFLVWLHCCLINSQQG